MDLSILSGDTMEFGDDDSFLFIRPEEMDDEVTQIFKKWKLNNPTLPKKDEEIATSVPRNETFDSRTFTRPPKRRTFMTTEQQVGSTLGTPPKSTMTDDMQSIESGIASINLQVGGVMTPLSMQKSWLLDVSPPSSICTSMDFQNSDNMLNSLITSSDFSNVNFLLNGTDTEKRMNHHINNTVILDKNATLTINNNPANITRNLMDFTFNVSRKPSNSTFITANDSEPPLKEIGIENADIQLNVSTEDFGKNLTFNKYDGQCANMTWDKIQQIHSAVVQSTPNHNANNETHDVKLKKNFEDDTLSPISSFHAQLEDDEGENVNGDVLLRSLKSRKLIDQIRIENEYRNSIEDQCEFLLNEETIKLSSRVCRGETFDCLDDLQALKNSTTVVDDEKEFDKMLDSFSVKKSLESEKLLQSVDSIKQRHSLINMEKQREDKKQQRTDNGESDNRAQYDTLNKSAERLLNRRSRLYDDFNSQLQKQQQQNGIAEGNDTENDSTVANGAESHAEVVDKNDRDRFKTIKLNRPRPQPGMVIIDTEETDVPRNEVSPGANKERQNQINQQKQEEVDKEFKKPAPVLKLSKFGYGLQRPSYSSRNNLNLPLKASSTDSLDNDSESFRPVPPPKRPEVSNLKSPMGIKSKSIHNLMYGAQQGRTVSNLKLSSDAARSQSNLKTARASSLVRPVSSVVENGYKLPQNENFKSTNATSRKTTLMRPSSGYYGNSYMSKKLDSDSESYSLSSSSASSRNSVHLSLAPQEPQTQFNYQKSTESSNISGAIPKPIAPSRNVASSLPRPSLKGLSGLPRPRR